MIPSPGELLERFPSPIDLVAAHRKRAVEALHNPGQCVWIVGPCSLHDRGEALEYAERLARLEGFVVMRACCEKPRTRLGWKGLVYDPLFDGVGDLAKGLEVSRSLLAELAQIVPLACEFLDPLVAPYVEDLVTWGFVGARTSSSQVHRQMASGMSFPMGMKNPVDGDLAVAEAAVAAARVGHVYAGLSREGRIEERRSGGNPHAHLVLRGGDGGPNFERHGEFDRVAVDCAHGNSRRDPRAQRAVAEAVWGQKSVAAVMVESYLETGCQARPGKRGLSVTDPCLGWEETYELVSSCMRSG